MRARPAVAGVLYGETRNWFITVVPSVPYVFATRGSEIDLQEPVFHLFVLVAKLE